MVAFDAYSPAAVDGGRRVRCRCPRSERVNEMFVNGGKNKLTCAGNCATVADFLDVSRLVSTAPNPSSAILLTRSGSISYSTVNNQCMIAQKPNNRRT